jgi:hypothetical protein
LMNSEPYGTRNPNGRPPNVRELDVEGDLNADEINMLA